MGSRIKDLIISMVKEEIETNPKFENYRDGLELEHMSHYCCNITRFIVLFRFKTKGRGRKDNTIRFDVTLDKHINEKIEFIYTCFTPKSN